MPGTSGTMTSQMHRSGQSNGHYLFSSAATGGGNWVVLSSAARLYGIDEVQICISVIER